MDENKNEKLVNEANDSKSDSSKDENQESPLEANDLSEGVGDASSEPKTVPPNAPESNKISKDSNSRKKIIKIFKNKKILIGIITGIIFIIILVYLIISSNKTIDGLNYGLDLNMKASKAVSLVDADNVTDGNFGKDDKTLVFTDDSFLGNDIYRIECNLNEKDRIDSITISYSSSSTNEEIIENLSKKYGAPIHESNYNDMNAYKNRFIWETENDVQLIYTYSNATDITLDSPILTFKMIEQENLDKKKAFNNTKDKWDDEQEKLYNSLLKRAKFENHPITEVIEKFKASYAENPEYETSAYGYFTYLEPFSYKGENYSFSYTVNSPLSDSPFMTVDYIGAIDGFSVKKEINDNYSFSDFKEVFEEIFGEFSKNESGYFQINDTPLLITLYEPTNSNNTAIATISINNDYCLIDPSFNNDSSRDKIAKYENMDLSFFPLKEGETEREVSELTYVGDKCINVAKEYMIARAKYPDTISFGKEIAIKKIGESFYVSGTLSAMNDLGRMRTDVFTVSIKREIKGNDINYNGILALVDGKMY